MHQYNALHVNIQLVHYIYCLHIHTIDKMFLLQIFLKMYEMKCIEENVYDDDLTFLFNFQKDN